MLISIFLAVYLSLLFVFASVVLTKKRNILLDKKYLNSIGVLYERFKIDNQWALAYQIIFMLRRVIFAIIMTLMGEYPFL